MNPFKPGFKPAAAETPLRGNEAMEVVRHRRDDLLRSMEAVRHNELMSKTATAALQRTPEALVPGMNRATTVQAVQRVMENTFMPKPNLFPAGVEGQAPAIPVEWQPQSYTPAEVTLTPEVSAPVTPAAQPQPAPAELDQLAQARLAVAQANPQSSQPFNLKDAA